MSCSLTEEELESAAFDLALNAREVLGLPTDTHKDQPHQAATPFRPEVLEAPPTALQFSQRLAGGSPPLIILGCIDDRSAISRWRDPDHLSRLMGNRLVKIAATPDGRADDLKMTSHGDLVFGLPAEVEMIFKDFVDQLNGKEDGPVYYLQSQDSNLTDPTSAAGDLTPLLPDLKDSKGSLELEWATQAMGAPPEAMNLWVGEHRSRSSMHQDHYENLFSVISGKKIFTVFPPTEAFYLCEDQPYPCHRHATKPPYVLEDSPDTNAPPTPWVPIDPTEPPTSRRNRPHARYAKGFKPLRIEVHPGETLYLPAGWWHFVEQEGDSTSRGVTSGVNWWYHSQAAFGPQWALLEFVKRIDKDIRMKASDEL